MVQVRLAFDKRDVFVHRLTKLGADTSTLSFISFKVGIPAILRNKALSPETWPSALTYRELRDYRTNNYNTNTCATTDTNSMLDQYVTLATDTYHNPLSHSGGIAPIPTTTTDTLAQPVTISSPAMTTTDTALFTNEPHQDLNERMLVTTTPTRSPLLKKDRSAETLNGPMNLLTMARRTNSNLALHPAMHLAQLILVSLSTTNMYVVYERKLQIFAWRYQNLYMILSSSLRLGLLSPYIHLGTNP